MRVSRIRQRATQRLASPHVETLERRIYLSAVQWDGGGGDFNWNTPANWSTDQLPLAEDDVSIPVLTNDIFVSGAAVTLRSLTSGNSIVIDGTSFALLHDSVINANLDVLATGSLDLADCAVEGLGSIRISPGATFTTSSTTLDISIQNSGLWHVQFEVEVHGGVTTTPNSTIRILAGTNRVSILEVEGDLANNGIIELTSDDIFAAPGRAAIRVVDGTLINESLGTILANRGSGSSGRQLLAELDNRGLLEINDIDLSLQHDDAQHRNSGRIKSTGLGVRFELGGELPSTFANTGEIELHAGHQLVFANGAVEWNDAVLSGEGSLSFVQSQIAFTTDFEVGDTPVHFAGSQLNGLGILSITSSGTAIFDSGAYGQFGVNVVNTPIVNAGLLQLYGTTELHASLTNLATGSVQLSSIDGYLSTGAANLTVTQGISNAGLFELNSTGFFIGPFDVNLNVSNGRFVNLPGATLRTLGHAGRTRWLNLSLDNRGSVEILAETAWQNNLGPSVNTGELRGNGGNLTIQQSAPNSSFENRGHFFIGNSQSLTVNGGRWIQHEGNIDGAGQFSLNGGVLELRSDWDATGIETTIGASTVIGAGLLYNRPGDTLSFHSGSYGSAGPNTVETDLTNAGSLTFHGLVTINGELSNMPGGDIVLTTINSFMGPAGAILTLAHGFINEGDLEIGAFGSFAATNDAIFNVLNGVLINAPGASIRTVGHNDRTRLLNLALENHGTISVLAHTLLHSPDDALINSGSLTVSSDTNFRVETPAIQLERGGTLNGEQSSRLQLTGDLLGTVNQSRTDTPHLSIQFVGPSSVDAPQLVEAFSADRGNVTSGSQQNFGYGTLVVSGGTYVRLIDLVDNAAGAGAEAVYVERLILEGGSTLDLNGLHLYYRSAHRGGSVTGGTIAQLPDGGAIQLGVPALGYTTGTIADDWSFYRRAGQAMTVILRLSGGSDPAPFAPQLSRGSLEVIGPDGSVLAIENETGNDDTIILEGITAPVEGTYRVRVRGMEGRQIGDQDSSGNYVVTVHDTTVTTRSLVFNSPLYGQLQNQFDLDRWTFQGISGQAFQFHQIALANPGIRFEVTGPGGFEQLGLGSDSDYFALPTTGAYSVNVHLAEGAYAFSLEPVTVQELLPGVPATATIHASHQSQLFRFTVVSDDPASPIYLFPNYQLQVLKLIDENLFHHNEIYVAYGRPPTRSDYDERFEGGAAASHEVVFEAYRAGVYFVLIYNNLALDPGAFELELLQPEAFHARGITPNRISNDRDERVRLNGFFPVVYHPPPPTSAPGNFSRSAAFTVSESFGGPPFTSRANVQFESVTGVLYPAAPMHLSFSSNQPSTYTDGSLDFEVNIPAGLLPAGSYTARITVPGLNEVQMIEAALWVVDGALGKLETELIVPNPVGFHEAATIYAIYRNIGNAAMPAPLLTVTATQNGIAGALLTLDASLVSSGFWTTANPDGYGQSVQFLASGAIPGVLLPGESVTVPVYYAGWLRDQWDFNRPPIFFSLGILDDANTQPVNWLANLESLRPPTIGPDVWAAFFPNLAVQLGDTWGEYLARLDADAEYLSRIGRTVTDVSDLYNFEVQQAIGITPIAALSSAVDAENSVPGGSLSFNRSFSPNLIERYQFGRFGWGWTDSWDTSLEVDADGTVNILGSGESRRRYQPDLRGGYLTPQGDHSKLRLMPGGEYVLTVSDGSSIAFRADGTLWYVMDTNANRITTTLANGRLTKLTHTSGQSLTLTYNTAGRVSTLTDAVGRVTTYHYDPTNQYLTSVAEFDGRTTEYTYDTSANPRRLHALTSVSYADGTHDFFEYDQQGRVSALSRDGDAERMAFTYDLGRVIATDALDNSTIYSFDHRGLLAQIQNPVNSTLSYFYDTNFNLIRTTDAVGQSYTNTYDTRGNLLSTTDPLGNSVQFSYSTQKNRLASVTDGNGNTTNYGYDGRGNLTSTTYANGTVESIAYDPVGNVLSNTNRRGEAIHYTYNAAGSVLSKAFSNGSVTTFTYDARDNLTSATDASGTITLAWNAHDRLTRITYPSGRYLDYTYDTAGRRIRMVDQTGFTVNYSYDSAGRLERLRDAEQALIVEYSYDVVGRLSRKDNGNLTYSTYTYDAAGQLGVLGNFAPDGELNSQFAYTYDALGRRITETQLDGKWSYTYDAIGQLTHAVFVSTNAEIADQDLQYVYDAAGNRVRTILNGVTTEYATNNMNQYTQVGDTSYAYDADGNMISEYTTSITTSYSYNAENRLTGISNGNYSSTYQYNAFGSRIASTMSATTTHFVIDPFGLGNVVSSYAGGTLASHFTYGLGLVSQTRPGLEPAYFDFNAVGSTATQVGGEGNSNLSPFGLPFGPSSGSLVFGFIGQLGVSTEENGLVNMRAREYAPKLGRFMSADPLNIAGGDVNLYSYVYNNPVMFVDPRGLWAQYAIYGYVALTKLTHNPRFFSLVNNVVSYYIDKNISNNWGTLLSQPDVKKAFSETFLKFKNAFSEGWERDVLDSPQAFRTAFRDRNFVAQFWMGSKFPEFPLKHSKPPVGPLIGARIGITQGVNSYDPNQKLGPSGYGSQGFVLPDQTYAYRIDFENDAEATAPAQRVDIKDQLDEHLDWSTFQWSSGGFGDNFITVPSNLQFYETTVSMTYNDKTFDVVITLDFDASTGLIHAAFQSIDPNTSLPPNVLTGFLPPEDETGRGQGFVSYLVRPDAGLPTGTAIRNIATIQFDLGEIIATNQIDPHDPSAGTDPAKEALVTIDAGTPNSSVTALPSVVYGSSFVLAWSGSDDESGSGIGSYDIFVSDNGGGYSLLLDNTTLTTTNFTGVLGHTYAFYSVATDNVGHIESTTGTPDTQTATSTPANQPPNLLDALFFIDENTALGTLVGTVSAIDPNSGDIVTYRIAGGNSSGAFSINSSTGTLTVANPGVLDFEITPIFTLTVEAEDNHGAIDAAIVQVNLGNINEAPQLSLSGSPVTWIKKQPATVVLPLATVAGANLGGGSLTISMNATGKKKSLDLLSAPSAAGFGITNGFQFANGRLTLQVQLATNATVSSIQNYLRGITFLTKGAGMKALTRLVTVTLTNTNGQSAMISQSINVKKKP